MKCQQCGKEIASNNKRCPYCGAPVSAQDGAWYKKWWIWVIAAVAAAAIAVTCILVFGSCGKKDATPATAVTTVGTTAAATSPTVPGKSIDQIAAEGYEKVSPSKLYKNIAKYRSKKVITSVIAKDIGTDTVYASLEENSKVLTLFQFTLDDPKELEGVKKGDYVAIYGTVDQNGSVSGTIKADKCHVAAVGSAAKVFADAVEKAEKATAPTTKPATTAASTAPTTKPATTAPATTAPATTAPATTAPATTAPADMLYNGNGLKVNHLSTVTDSNYVHIKISVENSSEYTYSVGAENCYVNGTPVAILGTDSVASGGKTDTELLLLKSDLDNAGVTSVEEIVFNFIFEDENKETVPVRSGSVVIKP